MNQLFKAIYLEAKYLLDSEKKLFPSLDRETWFLVYMIPNIDFVWGRIKEIQ